MTISNRCGSRVTIPTVDDVLADHADTNDYCHWDVEGGRIEITSDRLRRHLEAAYDPKDPSWPVFVDIPINPF